MMDQPPTALERWIAVAILAAVLTGLILLILSVWSAP